MAVPVGTVGKPSSTAARTSGASTPQVAHRGAAPAAPKPPASAATPRTPPVPQQAKSESDFSIDSDIEVVMEDGPQFPRLSPAPQKSSTPAPMPAPSKPTAPDDDASTYEVILEEHGQADSAAVKPAGAPRQQKPPLRTEPQKGTPAAPSRPDSAGKKPHVPSASASYASAPKPAAAHDFDSDLALEEIDETVPPAPAPKPQLVEAPAQPIVPVPKPGDEYNLSAARCPNCQGGLEPGAQFCVQCGTHLATGGKLDAAASSNGKTKEKKERPRSQKGKFEQERSKKPTVVALVVIILAGACGGYYFYSKRTPSGPPRDVLKRIESQKKGSGAPAPAPPVKTETQSP